MSNLYVFIVASLLKRISLRKLLHRLKIKCKEFESVEQAYEALATEQPDALFIEYSLARTTLSNGLDIISLIKQSDVLSLIPIIISVSQESKVDKFYFQYFERINYIYEPYKEDEVVLVINKLSDAKVFE